MPATDHDWTKPAAMAIPAQGYFVEERGRYGPVFSRSPIPVADISSRLGELPLDKEYIAYCRGPYCVYADEAVALLRANGRSAQRLSEGYPEWWLAGRPVRTA